MHQNDQNCHVKWVIECKCMFQILHEKNPPLHTFIEAECRGGARNRTGVHFFAEGEFVPLMIQYFFKLLLSEVQGPLQDAQNPGREVQMVGRYCRGPAGSSSCLAPVPAPARVPGLHFHPGTAFCSHPSLKQLVERTFCLPLSGVFLQVFPKEGMIYHKFSPVSG